MFRKAIMLLALGLYLTPLPHAHGDDEANLDGVEVNTAEENAAVVGDDDFQKEIDKETGESSVPDSVKETRDEMPTANEPSLSTYQQQEEAASEGHVKKSNKKNKQGKKGKNAKSAKSKKSKKGACASGKVKKSCSKVSGHERDFVCVKKGKKVSAKQLKKLCK